MPSVVAAGLLALVWVPRLRVPAPLHRAVAVVAGASLWIFLTHFAAFPLLRPHVEPGRALRRRLPDRHRRRAALVERRSWAAGGCSDWRIATAVSAASRAPGPEAVADGAGSGQPALSTGG